MLTLELAQLKSVEGDVKANLKKACDAVRNAGDKTDIMIFPEVFFSGFPTPENIESIAEPLDGSIIQTLHQVSKETGVAIVVGMAEKAGEHYYNTSVFVAPEGLLNYYRKTQLWLTDKEVFQVGDRYTTFEYKGYRIGILICFDIEYPETARALAMLDADLILVTNGNMDPYGYVHRANGISRALENQLFIAMVNHVGEDRYGHNFAGGSCVINPLGEVLGELGRVEGRCHVTIDKADRDRAREVYQYLNEVQISLPGTIQKHANGRYDFII